MIFSELSSVLRLGVRDAVSGGWGRAQLRKWLYKTQRIKQKMTTVCDLCHIDYADTHRVPIRSDPNVGVLLVSHLPFTVTTKACIITAHLSGSVIVYEHAPNSNVIVMIFPLQKDHESPTHIQQTHFYFWTAKNIFSSPPF